MLFFHVPGISLKGLTVELLPGNSVSLAAVVPLWQARTCPSNMARDRAREPIQVIHRTAITHVPTNTHTQAHFPFISLTVAAGV